MDFQFWIWLIVIVISLIARANKKKPPQGAPPGDFPDGGPQPSKSTPPKAITFEDLLREIQGEKALTKPAPQPVSKKVQKEYDYVDYDDDLEEEEQDLEEVDYSERDSKAMETYEAAKKLAFERPSLEETSKSGGDTVVRFNQFKEYEKHKKKRTSFNFLKEIKDPQGFKKAFIMSEILHRKY